jgi:hypothetical protein
MTSAVARSSSGNYGTLNALGAANRIFGAIDPERSRSRPLAMALRKFTARETNGIQPPSTACADGTWAAR